ncbi:hypothetical protein S7711_11094 [Stachybotrys chartarum IBT 7711]|uniref:Uncharacterized protein n=1 Tax=Stachybotrys chartarum (strain CBS 109288 / IBT 7711) TaxID=1280523 RepID=A0A084AL52_STACB|nr:hypothetical protein S7711_11094 [Stachybotrys chartarum IBT 7711]
MYTCLDRAQAYSAAKNNVFETVYAFNFHRTYSPPPNDNPTCSAPKTAERPFGDPQAEYYRSHGGSQVTMFGNHVRMDMPDRDGLDQDFSRLIVDYFSSFVRTGDPNLKESYLVARGYISTLAQVQAVGMWKEVDHEAPEWMILEWNGSMESFGETNLCSVLEQPLDYWELRPLGKAREQVAELSILVSVSSQKNQQERGFMKVNLVLDGADWGSLHRQHVRAITCGASSAESSGHNED